MSDYTGGAVLGASILPATFGHWTPTTVITAVIGGAIGIGLIATSIYKRAILR